MFSNCQMCWNILYHWFNACCRLAHCDSGRCALIMKRKHLWDICSLFSFPICVSFIKTASQLHTHAQTVHTLIRQPRGPASNTSDRWDEAVVSKTTTSLIQIYDMGCWNRALFLLLFSFLFSGSMLLLLSKGKAQNDHPLFFQLVRSHATKTKRKRIL